MIDWSAREFCSQAARPEYARPSVIVIRAAVGFVTELFLDSRPFRRLKKSIIKHLKYDFALSSFIGSGPLTRRLVYSLRRRINAADSPHNLIPTARAAGRVAKPLAARAAGRAAARPSDSSSDPAEDPIKTGCYALVPSDCHSSDIADFIDNRRRRCADLRHRNQMANDQGSGEIQGGKY